MKNENEAYLKNLIETDFGWLTPDEKQKLHILLKSTYNFAIDCSVVEIRESDYPEADPAFEVLQSVKNLKL